MSKTTQLLILCLSVTLSILVGIVTGSCSQITLLGIIVSILVFIVVEFLNVIYYLYVIKITQNKDAKYWKCYDYESIKLFNMNSYYGNILKDSHGENDLFVAYAKKEIGNVASKLKDAAEGKTMRISSDYIIYVDGVFDAFSLTNDKILKLTWQITNDQTKIFTAPPDARFFEVTIDMLKKHKITKIQVLVILDDEELLKRNNVKLLFSFFSSNAGYECRYVIASTFTDICNSNGMVTPTLEIGIYGPKMLFTVEKSSAHEYRGIYTKDQEKVNLATKIFDQTWSSESMSNENLEPVANTTYKDIKNS